MMDIYFQNKLGFDVYVTIEAADGSVVCRLYPKRQRPKRGMLAQGMLKDGETFIANDQPEDAKVSHDLTALTFKVRIEKHADGAGDLLFVFKLQNGHGHAP